MNSAALWIGWETSCPCAYRRVVTSCLPLQLITENAAINPRIKQKREERIALHLCFKFLNDGQGVLDVLLKAFKILFRQELFSNEFGSHPHADCSGIKPGFQVFFFSSNPTGRHDAGPRAGSFDGPHKAGSQLTAGKD